MNAERRLTEQGRERKQQILHAAEDLFGSRGYGPTRIADICALAGVAKGLFYWYFETKEAVFVELVRSMRHQLRRSQAAAMAASDDPLEQIRLGAAASMRFMAEHSAYFSLVETERASPMLTSVLRENSDVYVADVERLINAAQESAGLSGVFEPRMAAFGVLSTVAAFGQAHRVGRFDASVDELAMFVGDWVIRALGAPVTSIV